MEEREERKPELLFVGEREEEAALDAPVQQFCQYLSPVELDRHRHRPGSTHGREPVSAVLSGRQSALCETAQLSGKILFHAGREPHAVLVCIEGHFGKAHDHEAFFRNSRRATVITTYTEARLTDLLNIVAARRPVHERSSAQQTEGGQSCTDKMRCDVLESAGVS